MAGSSALEYMAPRSEPQILAPSSEPRSVAPRYRPRQRHLGCPDVHGQTPRSQDLWRRDVLPRSYESWRRPQGPKMSLHFSGAKRKFSLKKRDQIAKKLELDNVFLDAEILDS